MRSVFLASVFGSLLCTASVSASHSEGAHATMAHKDHGVDPATIAAKTERVSGTSQVRLTLTDLKDAKPVLLDDLKEVHTEKIHLLIIDPSLSDYTHIHPVPTKTPGVYTFEWSPKLKGASYKLWADVHPLSTDRQEYTSTMLEEGQASQKIEADDTREAVVDGYRFNLQFEGPLEKGQAVGGVVKITDDKGRPVTILEPLMGAYGHLVGFGDDFETLIHIHPMGPEPTEDSARGGPDLSFHLEPGEVDFIKFFVQVKIDGKELYAPFGLKISDKKKS
ncbi:MAG: hypothetical protein H2057_06585 [Alphaproteobacteria bacterium]|nr:hypothetical protein [Alphaproteobacteria bacterium]